MAQKTVTLKVSGERLMQCAGCEQAVMTTLSRLHGVYIVDASHHTQEIGVTYDPDKVGIEDMKRALLKAGYKADAQGG